MLTHISSSMFRHVHSTAKVRILKAGRILKELCSLMAHGQSTFFNHLDISSVLSLSSWYLPACFASYWKPHVFLSSSWLWTSSTFLKLLHHPVLLPQVSRGSLPGLILPGRSLSGSQCHTALTMGDWMYLLYLLQTIYVLNYWIFFKNIFFFTLLFLTIGRHIMPP